MKLTKHQENIMTFLASRHKTSSKWVTATDASRACGSNYSQQSSTSWALPKLRTLVKKGLLISATYTNPISGNDAYMFSLNPETKTAFRLLLKVE